MHLKKRTSWTHDRYFCSPWKAYLKLIRCPWWFTVNFWTRLLSRQQSVSWIDPFTTKTSSSSLNKYPLASATTWWVIGRTIRNPMKWWMSSEVIWSRTWPLEFSTDSVKTVLDRRGFKSHLLKYTPNPPSMKSRASLHLVRHSFTGENSGVCRVKLGKCLEKSLTCHSKVQWWLKNCVHNLRWLFVKAGYGSISVV